MARLTRTHEELGEVIDVRPEGLGLRFFTTSPERKAVNKRECRAQEEGDSELVRQLGWERGIMDLYITRSGWDLESACPVGRADLYSAFHGFTQETRSYALQRTEECNHPALRLHHLEYLLRTTEATGREWVEICRRTAAAYRQFVDLVVDCIQPGDDGVRAVPIDEAITRIKPLIKRQGILHDTAQREWARWMVRTAQRLQDVKWSEKDYNQPHRWPFEVLKHLTAIEPANIPEPERETALRLVAEAYDFFSPQPLADTFASKVAEVEHDLRRHFGEAETHRTLIRRQYAALRQKAQFFAEKGNHLGASVMFRQAWKLASKHSQYFDDLERRSVEQGDRDAIDAALTGGNFKSFRFAVDLDPAVMDRTRESAEATVADLLENALGFLPAYRALEDDARATGQDTRLVSLLPAITIDEAKVVREAFTEEQHLAADVETRLCLHARFIGGLVHVTMRKAAQKVGLGEREILAPLLELPNEGSSQEILLRGIERYLAADYISAVHVLIPQFEESLRNLLRTAGFSTASFHVVDLHTGASRTDDMTFGALLRAAHQQNNTVEEVLGENLWHYISATMASPSGLNLRNRVAHGLARLPQCSAETVGITLHLLFCLVAIWRGLNTAGPSGESA